MAGMGSIRRVFPGGNTSCGFYSFYDFILPQHMAAKIFVIKGGPGVGKSTFMKKIGDEMVGRGFDIEYHQCSSDNDSLDGLVIPALNVALIDGTAPHVVDPKNPGAVDEIINLGEYWDETKVYSARGEIMKVNAKTGKLFRTAYSLLSEAKIAYDEWKGYITESVDSPKYYEISNNLVENVFHSVYPDYRGFSGERHLFASAITPGGLKNYIDTIIRPGMRIFSIEGEPGSGVKELVARVALAAREKGLFTEQFHCPFEPEYLDMVLIPALNTAVVNTSAPFHYDISKAEGVKAVQNINLDRCIFREALKEYLPEIQDAKNRFYSLLANAVNHLSRAKEVHDSMEKYYVSSMDFEKVEAKRKEVLEKILKIAEG